MKNEGKVKVLHFVDRMGMGGIQTFLVNNMKYMDTKKVQIDYLLLDDGVSYLFEDTVKQMGSKVYKLEGIWINRARDYIKYAKKLNDFFKVNYDYKILHMHSSSKNFLVLYYAKKYGIKIRIAHSHNIEFQSKSKVKVLLGNFFKIFLTKTATHYFACSEMAGRWLFGEKILKKGKLQVVPNAVDIDNFKYNDIRNKEIRKELGIEDKIVIGHVGRFTKQKNHEYLIYIFYEIYKLNNNAVLLLIGEGQLENYIKTKVKQLGIEEKVIFMGVKNNVNEYMCVMDAFVFPSLFEGLGIALIEAQVNGLPCFTSADVVPCEANVSDTLKYISLNDSPKEWANEILRSGLKRNDNIQRIIDKNYSIDKTYQFLEKFYMGNMD